MQRTDRNDNVPAFGERVATFLEGYMAEHHGLTISELAFRLRADKRDLRRAINDKSCGKPLEERCHSYFGRLFGEHVYGDLWGAGPSRREIELERERSAIAARRERLERDRAEARSFRSAPPALVRMGSDEDGRSGL